MRRFGQDFWAGLLFVVFGIAAIAIARGYKLGAAANMGPGYMPIAVGALLVLCGLALSLRSIARRSMRVSALAWLPTLLILASILVFSFFVRSIGLALTAIVLVLLCRAAGSYWGWRANAQLAIALAALVVLIFGYGLTLSLPLWPGQD